MFNTINDWQKRLIRYTNGQKVTQFYLVLKCLIIIPAMFVSLKCKPYA